MVTQIERLKQKSIQFTIVMVQKRLDEFLVHEILETDDNFKETEILFKDIQTKEDLKTLKEFFKTHKSKFSRTVYQSCTEELREITSDLKWSNSKEGKEVVNLEEWVLNARKFLSGFDEFK